jgi:hypothetical protein
MSLPPDPHAALQSMDAVEDPYHVGLPDAMLQYTGYPHIHGSHHTTLVIPTSTYEMPTMEAPTALEPEFALQTKVGPRGPIGCTPRQMLMVHLMGGRCLAASGC